MVIPVTWIHVVATMQYANNALTACIFVNGVQNSCITESSHVPGDMERTCRLGHPSYCGSPFDSPLNGQMRLFRIYAGMLGSNEILALYESAIATESPTFSPVSSAPQSAPTKTPTMPTKAPTAAPSATPTKMPTSAPTRAPSSAPSAAPTSAPTLLQDSIVFATCGDPDNDFSDPAPCGVEGTDTLTVVGSFPTNTQLIVNIHTPAGDINVSCTNVTASFVLTGGAYVGYERIQCTPPCFSTALGADLEVSVCHASNPSTCMDSTQAFRDDLANAPVRMQYKNNPFAYSSSDVDDFVCVDAPIIASIACVTAEECTTHSSGILEVPPNTVVVITGEHFGSQQPTTADVSMLHVLFGVKDCADFQQWSDTQITLTMCASGGDQVEVKVKIGTKISTVTSVSQKIIVKIAATVPRNFALALDFSGGEYTPNLTWEAPSDDSNVGYIVEFASVEFASSASPCMKSISKSPTKYFPSDSNTSMSGTALLEGVVACARIGAVYSRTSGVVVATTSSWTVEDADWTDVTFLQAARAPAQPLNLTVSFIGTTWRLPGQPEDRADLLLRFATPAFNGAKPDLGNIAYAGGSGLAQLQDTQMQLAVLTGVPIGELKHITVRVTTSRVSGLEGDTATLTSPDSEARQTLIRAPNTPHSLRVTFASIELGSTVFTATIAWESEEESAENAKVTTHSIWSRAAAPGTVCNATTPCERTALAQSEYTEQMLTRSPQKVFAVTLALPNVYCFIVVATNAIGSSGSSAMETCIDPVPEVRSKCTPGTELVNTSIWVCEDCPLGTKNPAQGGACSPCNDSLGEFTPSTRAVACSICNVGTFLNSSDATECLSCFVGMFAGENDGKNDVACKQCAEGKYTKTRGQSACDVCTAGQFVESKTDTFCTFCPTGKYRGDEDSECRDCETAHYTPRGTGSTACLSAYSVLKHLSLASGLTSALASPESRSPRAHTSSLVAVPSSLPASTQHASLEATPLRPVRRSARNALTGDTRRRLLRRASSAISHLRAARSSRRR